VANKICPICGEENNCMARKVETGHCWCDSEEFPQEIFELIPPESRKKHCICKKCLDKFKAVAEEKTQNKLKL
jgi:hypothetical protein